MGTRVVRSLLAAGLVAGTSMPLSAQTIGMGMDYMGYSFDEGLGADAAQLLMIPVGVRFALGESLSLDLYSAWAQGKVEQDGIEYTLQGPVDAQVKASYQVGNWALLSVGAGLPTGNAGHNPEEAVVASVLATDLFGFREATWGTGFALTTSVATAMRAGGFGVGLAGAYSVRGEFEPSTDLDLSYRPGDESRVRLGIDRNFGTSTFTAGLTFMTYQQDQADGQNLFQAGNRYRADATYMFRAGAGVWTVYAADLWRENGDLTLSIVDAAGDPVGDTLITTAKQNLLVAGVVGAVSMGGSYVFRPHVDFKYQAREEVDGRDEGTGWVVAAGGDIPVRLFGRYDFFPKARVLYGSIKDPEGQATSILGAEISATVRWSM